MNLDRNTLSAVIAHTRWLHQHSPAGGVGVDAASSRPPAVTRNGVTYYRSDLVTRVTEDLLERERLAVRMACETLRITRPSPPDDRTCSGCDVRVGQRHWDNCPLVPAFSQPVFTGE